MITRSQHWQSRMQTEQSPAQVSIQLDSSRPSVILVWVVGGVLESSHSHHSHHTTCAVMPPVSCQYQGRRSGGSQEFSSSLGKVYCLLCHAACWSRRWCIPVALLATFLLLVATVALGACCELGYSEQLRQGVVGSGRNLAGVSTVDE